MSAPLIGATIVNVRPMTDEELEANMWSARMGDNPVALELDTGDVLYPSADPEGNGPGAMFGYSPTDDQYFMLNPSPTASTEE